MVNEALCEFLCHDLCCLIQEQCELGIEAEFWKDKPQKEEVRHEPEACYEMGLAETEWMDWA